MKNKIIGLVVLVPCAASSNILSMPVAYAQNQNGDYDYSDYSDITARWGIGYRIGGVDKDGKTPLDARIEQDINLTWGIIKYLALEIEGAYVSDKDLDKEFYDLFGDLLLRFPIDSWCGGHRRCV